VSNRSLTIVLPVYNCESRLSQSIEQMLELASDLTTQFSILIVDDGSTDETSTVAQELATRFPQVRIRRQRQRTGLGPIISMVERRVDSDVVIVHDGVTPVDAAQVRRLWRQCDSPSMATATASKRGMNELASVRSTHDAMALAHERVMGFHLLEPQRRAEPASAAESTSTIRSDAKPRATDRRGVGIIPPLPRPNFLSAIAEFTLGE
jgi:Glycosyl transferase family 2